MKKNAEKLIPGIFFFIGLSLFSGCDIQKFLLEGTGLGILTGTIKIGPLCPVETVPPNPACLPTEETYKAYAIGIWTSDGKQKVNTIHPELNGSYVVDLPAGFYLIDRENTQTGIRSNLPLTVGIADGYTTVLNISIDTGIR